MQPYRLIDCGFHDELEALATLRQTCQIVYHKEDGVTETLDSRIVDVYAQAGADFIKLQNGTIIRADQLISVAGKAIAFANSPFSCA